MTMIRETASETVDLATTEGLSGNPTPELPHRTGGRGSRRAASGVDESGLLNGTAGMGPRRRANGHNCGQIDTSRLGGSLALPEKDASDFRRDTDLATTDAAMTDAVTADSAVIGSGRSARGRWPVYGLAVLLGAALLPGCDHGRSTHGGTELPSEIERLAVDARDRDPAVQTLARGRAVYEHSCLICHGSEGHGDGFNSSNVSVSPRDFSEPAFRQTTDPDHLFKAIQGGGTAVGKSVLMPASDWRSLLS